MSEVVTNASRDVMHLHQEFNVDSYYNFITRFLLEFSNRLNSCNYFVCS